MEYVNYNITAEEEFRLTGQVTGERLQVLLKYSEAASKFSDLGGKIQEAYAQFPAEDFLSEIESRLHELAKRLRGNNKEELLGIIESLSDVAQCTFYATECGTNELDDALAIVGEMQ